MRIAVIADTHLGYKQGTELENDAFEAASEAFEKAVCSDPDVILLLGDIFDHKVEKPEILNKAIKLFKRLKKCLTHKQILITEKSGSSEIIPIISIYGTHETRHKDAINPVHLLHQTGLVKNLHQESILLEKNGQKIGVHGLSGVDDSFAEEELKNWSPIPFPNSYNIILLHQTFKEDLPQVENVMTYNNLPSGFDLFLFGHIHDHHERSIRGAPILYPGSTVRTQYGKNTLPKLGFYVLEVENNQLIKKEFVKLDSPREFIYHELTISDLAPADISNLILETLTTSLNKSFTKKPIVKIKLFGKLKSGFTAADFNLTPVLKRFENAIIKIDKSNLETEQSKERLKLLANLGEERKSIESFGVEILYKNLQTNLEKSKVAELFELLSEGNIEAAESILEIKNNSQEPASTEPKQNAKQRTLSF